MAPACPHAMAVALGVRGAEASRDGREAGAQREMDDLTDADYMFRDDAE